MGDDCNKAGFGIVFTACVFEYLFKALKISIDRRIYVTSFYNKKHEVGAFFAYFGSD